MKSKKFVKIPEETKEGLKMLATLKSLTLSDITALLISEYMRDHPTPGEDCTKHVEEATDEDRLDGITFYLDQEIEMDMKMYVLKNKVTQAILIHCAFVNSPYRELL